MKKILVLLLCVCVSVLSAEAQYVRVNYDKKTVAAMAAAYATETATEAYYTEQVKDILDKYSAAEVAAAGIFLSKFLDRKALTDLGIWSDGTENYYYRRIYHLVSAKIMPKIWTVAGQMLHSPQTALYWGSYLMKICTEVKALCMQFESVVTNGTLSFRDVVFLEIAPQFAPLFKLSESGGIDWEAFFDDLGNIQHNFTKENLKADIDNLYNIGVGLANTGADNFTDAILGESSFDDLLNGKVSDIARVAGNAYDLYGQLEHSMGNTLLSMVGGPEGVANLFQIDNYNLTSWISDYLKETAGQYYTQRWYIYRRDAGAETLCDYTPPTDDNSILYGGEWTRFNTTNSNFYPNSSQTEQILNNSERYAGWSRAQVEQMNQSNDGYTYSISYYRSSYNISKGGKQIQKAYAYSIRVTRSWNQEEVVYEEVFDSYKMDLNTFKAGLNARLSEFNDNEEGYTYVIGSDAKHYYQATDEAKLQGCESVIVSVTCHDGVTLSSGSTQYKCRTCGGSLNNHSKECAMQTTVSGGDELDLSGLDELENEYNAEAAVLQSQIDALEVENAELVKQIASATVEETASLRQQYNRNKDEINRLESDLTTVRKKQDELAQAKEEAAADNAVPTDDYYRIPALMQECRSAYSLTWQGDGWWSGYCYLREATAPNINGTITFKATLSIARKPKYFLGIKIHRAIMQISWELTAEYSDTEVVDIIELDPAMSESEKATLVNDRLSEIARQYPSCEIITEYVKSEPVEEDTTTDTYHLLWASDRLEIARQVEARLTNIFADLVALEKMMNYKLSIIDVLKDIAPFVNDERGRRLTLVEECRRRWLRGAANSLHSVDSTGNMRKRMMKEGRKGNEQDRETYPLHGYCNHGRGVSTESVGAMELRHRFGGSLHQRPQAAAKPVAGPFDTGTEQPTPARIQQRSGGGLQGTERGFGQVHKGF